MNKVERIQARIRSGYYDDQNTVAVMASTPRFVKAVEADVAVAAESCLPQQQKQDS